jgi:catechol 2,3-dioxygenase-like lactoylglutathione lyase family enzyme
MTVGVECIIRILRVRKLTDSVRFYVDALGFRLDWEAGDTASVSSEGQAIMLCQGAQGHAEAWVWIGVEPGIESLHEGYSARGAPIRLEPTNFSWAYEMRIGDSDGPVLRFGSGPKADMPFEDT